MHKIALANQPITLGVLAYLPEEQMLERYQPLADYLTNALKNREVRVLPLSYQGDQIENAITENRLDLLLTNPSHYIKLRTTHKLSGAMLTQVVLRSGEAVSSFGGVIVTLADNQQIVTLEDLNDVHIAAADLRSLGGYQAQIYEIYKQGIELRGRFSFLKKHNAVINAVLTGDADVGFVRSGVIESMAQSGALDVRQIKLINQKMNPAFPFAHSTSLYPEWPLLALPQLSDSDVRRVASALLDLDISHPAARAANIGGFNPPADYQEVDTLARTLRVSPYDQAPEFTLYDIWNKHLAGLLVIAVTIVIIVFLLSLLLHRNNQLRHNAEKLRRAASVFSNATEGIVITNSNGKILDVNSAFEEITGYSRSEAVGKRYDLVEPGFHSDTSFEEIWYSLAQSGGWQGELWCKHKNGQKYAVQLMVGAIKTNRGEMEGHVLLLSDITQKLFFSSIEDIRSNAMQSTIEGSPLSETLDKILKDIELLSSETQCSILLLDKSGKHLFNRSAPSLPEAYSQAIDGIAIGDGIGSCGTAAYRQQRVIVENIQEHPFWADFKGLAAQHDLASCWSEPIFGKKGRLLGTFAIYHQRPTAPSKKDIHLIERTVDFISLLLEGERAEQELIRLATTDELTSLANRRQLLAIIDSEIERAKRYKTPLSFCMVDLDNFKAVNDLYGHEVGDEVLKAVAEAMKGFIRTTDMVGRLGGEEFGIILPNTAHDDALTMADRLRLAIEELTVVHEKSSLNVTISVGVSSIRHSSETVLSNDLLSLADRCLYYAKRSGRNRVSDKPIDLDIMKNGG
ncbi:diguanylate cyclase [Vibrio sp. SCSIO 43137]|uniref:diguanylate cyclase n=1 Tax=Vibrio sp. SCSIO 43137 TaxID=3021011 RepID=UPI002307FBFD|nr:diguanylate cyclase [Vibrio sp. SCSIO 43137]WCE32107.1 diguanylate cyclase [Vibrio sp. SCSIO 43137]